MSRQSSGAVRLWLEDYLLHVPRQNISAHVPMRLDVSSVGLIDPHDIVFATNSPSPHSRNCRARNRRTNGPTSSWSSMTIGFACWRRAAVSCDLRETRTRRACDSCPRYATTANLVCDTDLP